MSDERLVDSKYRRWPPAMDNLLVELLSHVVHSFPKDGDPVMTKEAWVYVCNLMRARNPQAVYLTYTKYLCTQHLYNVIQWRYRMWLKLATFTVADARYRYHWHAGKGRFVVEEGSPATTIDDTNVLHHLVATRELLLPQFDEFNRIRLPQVLMDLFVLDNLRYMLVYHNEVFDLLVRTDYRFQLPPEIESYPPFDYPEARLPYSKPLKPRQRRKHPTPPDPPGDKDAPQPASSPRPPSLPLTAGASPKATSHSPAAAAAAAAASPSLVAVPASRLQTPPPALVVPARPVAPPEAPPEVPPEAPIIVDPALVVEAAAAAAALLPVVDPLGAPIPPTPVFVRDRKWFTKLLDLHRTGHLGLGEVHLVCVGVRDGKIPLFMLNVLDQHYYRDAPAPMVQSDDQIAYHVRQYMLPMLNF